MRFYLLLFTLLNSIAGYAQTNDSDYYLLPSAEIKSSSLVSKLRLLSSEITITQDAIKNQPGFSILPALNTVAGVRMEERSPGSYRLSVRGSLLRSPFGVRNVKIYLNNLPFTDAGGNSYLNSLDLNNAQSLKVLKGPSGSFFGANTGGVLLINPVKTFKDSFKAEAVLSVGSYGLFKESILIHRQWKKVIFDMNYSYQRANNYRDNSAMNRDYLQLASTWVYNKKSALKFLGLISDLNYKTPGGLNKKQFDEKPSQSRPATLILPSAKEQKAAIYNTTYFGGITNEYAINENLIHVISVFGSATVFKNPFITNYEKRDEYSFGTRTYFDLKIPGNFTFKNKFSLGAEWQRTSSLINNYDNIRGDEGSIQASDKIRATQSFYFARFQTDIRKRLLIEASASYNLYAYSYKNIFPSANTQFTRNNFSPSILPRVSLNYLLTKNISMRAIVSSGYSSPTIAEIRSSNNIVNVSLQAEKGINYEAGIRMKTTSGKLWIDLTAFYFNLNQAIVRRLDSSGNEYFINAGKTVQPGIEVNAGANILSAGKSKIIKTIDFNAGFTYSRFKFGNYISGLSDFSGNKLTGVPAETVTENINIGFPGDVFLYVQHYYCSSLPLDDANSAKANSYNLVQIKISWDIIKAKYSPSVFFGIDNLLNEKYSLGNDLNAVGGRYYNAAPPFNFYGGVKLSF
ncbi:MAG: TonB-dependent receptor [Bacteroidia bacterium]|nr:TonB-dependent receptor [Bacteroidia bacterium]